MPTCAKYILGIEDMAVNKINEVPTFMKHKFQIVTSSLNEINLDDGIDIGERGCWIGWSRKSSLRSGT